MRLFTMCAAVLLVVGLTGCSKSDEPMPKTGFLPDYSLLQPVKESPKNTQMYLYKNPDAKRSDYHATMITPVALYQTATEHGISQQQIDAARREIDKGVHAEVSQMMPVTTTPGKGVAVLSVAITGATVEEDGFGPMNIIPISAAIKLASMATDLDSKNPAMIVELKFTDSVTGELLLESVSVVKGESFRKRSSTAGEFETMAKTWIKEGLTYSMNQR